MRCGGVAYDADVLSKMIALGLKRADLVDKASQNPFCSIKECAHFYSSMRPNFARISVAALQASQLRHFARQRESEQAALRRAVDKAADSGKNDELDSFTA